jgi:hypothetical protein
MGFGLRSGRKRPAKKSTVPDADPALAIRDFKFELTVPIKLYKKSKRPVPIKHKGHELGEFAPFDSFEHQPRNVLEVEIDQLVKNRLILVPAVYWGLGIVVKDNEGTAWILKPPTAYRGAMNAKAYLRLDGDDYDKVLGALSNARELADLLSAVLTELRWLSRERQLITLGEKIGQMTLRVENLEGAPPRRARRKSSAADHEQSELELGSPKKPNGDGSE